LLLAELEAESRLRNESLFQPFFQDAHLGRLFARLAARGFSPQSAAQLTAQLEREAALGATFEQLVEALHKNLVTLWRVAPGLADARGPAPAAALIGAAGAGKTATIAKLAVRYGVAERQRVRLVAVDPFRVGAVEALEAYADLLDLPLTVVEDAAELPEVLEQLRLGAPRPDRILVDTQGYGPAESDRESRLCEALHACAHLDIYPTVSATERPAQASRRGPAAAEARGLIFTRLDETTAPGALFDESLRLRLPIAFLTAGQNSLHDLIAADAEVLTSMALGVGRGVSASSGKARAAASDHGFENLSPSG